MKRCVIVGGADISNYCRINGIITGEDYIIFCDSGLKHMQKLSVQPARVFVKEGKLLLIKDYR